MPRVAFYHGMESQWASICTSVNHVVCHGVPVERKLKPGDILNIDVTVIKDGWHGDSSRMFFVGTPSIQAKRLVEITHEAMWRGIRAVRPGAHLGDIGHAIQRFAEGHHFSVVREFCGHGIGRSFHEEPQVLHYGRAGTGLVLEPGMVFTIEPMTNAGRAAIRALADGWPIVTADHSLSARGSTRYSCRLQAGLREAMAQVLGRSQQRRAFEPPAVIARAKSRLGESRFDIMLHNCEHFATWCKTGISDSEQVWAIWRATLGPADYWRLRRDGALSALLDRDGWSAGNTNRRSTT